MHIEDIQKKIRKKADHITTHTHTHKSMKQKGRQQEGKSDKKAVRQTENN